MATFVTAEKSTAVISEAEKEEVIKIWRRHSDELLEAPEDLLFKYTCEVTLFRLRPA